MIKKDPGAVRQAMRDQQAVKIEDFPFENRAARRLRRSKKAKTSTTIHRKPLKENLP